MFHEPQSRGIRLTLFMETQRIYLGMSEAQAVFLAQCIWEIGEDALYMEDAPRSAACIQLLNLVECSLGKSTPADK